MIEICATSVETLISLRRLLMLYTKARKSETKLIQLLTEKIKQIKTDVVNSPLETFVKHLIFEYVYPREFETEAEIDENIFELEPFIYDTHYYP